MSPDYIYFIVLLLLKMILEIQGSWQSVQCGKSIKKRSEMHCRWNHFYWSEDHLIYSKGIQLEEKTALEFFFYDNA